MRHSTPNTRGLGTPAIFVLALLSAVAPLATDMYLPGFPLMAGDLATSASAIQLTLTSFLIGLALGQLLIGPLSDRFGRRRPLLLGTGLAIVSGYLCAVAPGVDSLIALRFLQGLGGGAGVVLARAIISDRTSDATASARLFQVMMLIGGLAPVLAPIIGTGIVSLAGWRAVFVVVASLSVLAFLGTLRQLDESLPPENRSEGGMAGLRQGMKTVCGNRLYLGYTLTVGFAFMVMFAYISASPFVMQTVLGLSPLAYSLAFGLNAIGIVLASAVSAKLVSRVSPARLTSIGIVANTIGALCTLLCVLAGAGAVLTLPALFVTVASLGLILGNASALAISQVPRSAGTASAVLGALQFCLGAIASPLVGLAGKDSALPMALVMVVAALLAVAALLTTRSSRSLAAEAA
ncbi:multidrug effflux MFS transporter [Albibacillus kandeliae]|uniref:multidrug effflux MFS transporter n=1 Tax=Albibacillus kandeliae TaxID=2174228 RepID=UPI000D6932FD|nr:multidrug effflux MFS transporter [Albibacillus kandeliae]